jgi:hypothetical protein
MHCLNKPQQKTKSLVVDYLSIKQDVDFKMTKCLKDHEFYWDSGKNGVKSEKKYNGYVFFTTKEKDKNSIFLSSEEMETLVKQMEPTILAAEKMYLKAKKKNPETKIASVTYSIAISNKDIEEPQTCLVVQTYSGEMFYKTLCCRDDIKINVTNLTVNDLRTFYNVCTTIKES